MSYQAPKSQYVPVKYATTRLGAGVTQAGQSLPGGLDLTTPSLALQPGALRDVLNFECAQSGGYSRIEGYERFDGQVSPSEALYTIVQVVSFTNVPSVGQVITQAGSGATGTIIAVVTTASGPYVALTQVTGAFNYTGALTTPGPVAVGTATSPVVAISALLNAQYLALAADVYRALIGAVPGSGNILGVVGMTFGGTDYVYAFRANVGATAVNIYKSTAAGWVQVPFFNTISFTNGGGAQTLAPGTGGQTIVAGQIEIIGGSLIVQNSAGIIVQGTLEVSDVQPEPLDGDVLTQGAVTATIKRVMTQSGSWDGGSAAGKFVITTPAGGSFAAGTATTSSGATVILTGTHTAITLTPGSRFEFVKANFSGQLVTRRIYGCDGTNQCFEFDGTTLSPITTGLDVDVPSHITFHKTYLVVSQGSSIMGCGASTPFRWGADDGGWEIATGDNVNGMMTMPGSQTSPTLGVYMQTSIGLLYGTDPTTFNFTSFNIGTGAFAHTPQNLSDTFIMDDMGVTTLRTTLNWGNFSPTALTKNILPFIKQEQTKVTDSSVHRLKSQYRVFFSDGYGLWLTMVNQEYLGASVVLFPNPVFCVDEGDNSLGQEFTYFGSNDGQGYIYQMDVGTSFDGAAIDAYITPAWDSIKSPRILKRFRAVSIEMQGTAYAAVQFGYQLGYGSTLIGQPSLINTTSAFASNPVWDAMTWDAFIWDGRTLSPTDVDVTGTAENVQPTIRCGTNYIAAFTINSIIYHYSMRRGLRV